MKKSMKIVMGLIAVLAIALTFAVMNLAPEEGALGMLIAAPIVLASIETSVDARQKRKAIWDQMETMIQLRKTEQRSFTADEQTKYDNLKTDFDLLTRHLEELEAQEKRAIIMANTQFRNEQNNQVKKELGAYSFSRAIMSRINGTPLDGIEREMHDEAQKEMREANVGKNIQGIGVPNIYFRAATATGISGGGGTVGDKGGMLVPVEKSGLLETLRPFLILSELGANTLGNLSGNIDFPKGSAATAGFKTEVADADEYDPTFSMVTMTPKRLPALAKYSQQLLLQSSPDVESFIKMQLYKAIAQAVEQAAISGAGGGTIPAGILATVGIGSVVGGANGLAIAWSHIADLEEKVAVANADRGALAYLTNPKVRSRMKQTLKASGVLGYIWDGGEAPLNGYKTGITTLVPSNLTKGSGAGVGVCSAVVFGNFNDLVIGQWGGMDLIVDPYTAKKNGIIEVAANTYWDCAVLGPESFAAMLDVRTDI